MTCCCASCLQLEWEWAKAGNRSTSCADYLRQIGYREYGRYLSFHFPFTHERSLLEHLQACPWNFDQSLFKVSALSFEETPYRFTQTSTGSAKRMWD